MAELDKITIATRNFISKARNRIVDSIFNSDPIFRWLLEHGTNLDEMDDPFDEWVARVRAEHEMIAGINGS